MIVIKQCFMQNKDFSNLGQKMSYMYNFTLKV